MSTRKLAAILDEGAELGVLGARARQVKAVQLAFREIAPPELARFCRSSLTRGGILFVIAENGAVAAKLRQMSTRLLQGFRARGYQCTGLKVEAQADRPSRPDPDPTATAIQRRLSHTTVALLADAAQAASDSPLKAALTRMARRHAARLESSLQNVKQDENDPRDD